MPSPLDDLAPEGLIKLFGHGAMLAEVVDDLARWRGASHALIAGLHMGKAAFLTALNDAIRTRADAAAPTEPVLVPVPVGLQLAAGVESEEKLLGFVLKRITKEIAGASCPGGPEKHDQVKTGVAAAFPIVPDTCSAEEFEATLGQLIAALDSVLGRSRIVLLVRHIEIVADQPWADPLFDHFNALVHDGDVRDSLRLVLAGSERLLAVRQRGSPLVTRLTLHFMQPLTDPCATGVLAVVKGIDPAVTAEVVAQAGGHPFLLKSLIEGLSELDDGTVTLEAVKGMVAQLEFENGEVFHRWWQAIGPESRRLYALLRRLGDWTPRFEMIRAIGPETDEALKRLTYYGLVAQDGSYRRYRACGGIFSDWSRELCDLEAPVAVRLPNPPQLTDTALPLAQLEELQAALLVAYNPSSFEQMLFFRLDVKVDEVAAPGNFRDVVFQVIKWAQSKGRLEELILQASQYNLGNEAMRGLMKGSALALSTHVPWLEGGHLEAQVLASVKFADVTDWRALCALREQAVCLIEGPVKSGTGVLIAADRVLTCFHVVKELEATSGLSKHVAVRFDYKTDEPGIETSTGRAYTLASTWLLGKSPVEALDFAVLQLAEPAGEDEVVGLPGTKRGWVTPIDAGFEVGAPIFIMQHPASTMMKISGGAIRTMELKPPRIVYTANTLPGSSGAPCFSHGWDLIALHQAGDAAIANKGIPCSAILPFLP
jgi:hypothetical protein